MPTQAQIDAVERRIEELETEHFRPVDGWMRTSEAVDSVPWGDLTETQKLGVLSSAVDWNGFDVSQQVDVSTRAVDGERAEDWMGDIVASDRREHLKALATELREEEHDARVQVFGEADAATYDQRMAEAYRQRGEGYGPPGPESPPISGEELDKIQASWDATESIAEGPAEPDLFVERETKLRELFDTSNRVLAAKYIQDHNLDLGVATRSSDQVREVIFREAEKTWDRVREEGMFRTDAEIDETLRMFREMEAALEPSRTIMDILRENGAFVDPALDPTRGLGEPSQPVRPLTRELIECCQLDVWPGHATVVDFGLDSSSHLGALQFAIREDLVTPQELDAAMGKGEALTEIAQRGENPYRFVTFETSWDRLNPEPESPPESGGGNQAPASELAPAAVDASRPDAQKPTAPEKSAFDRALAAAADVGKYRKQDQDKGRDR